MAKKTVRKNLILTETQEQLEAKVHAMMGYANASAAYVSFLRWCGVTQKEHSTTREWELLAGDEQDDIDRGILDLMEKGEGARGSWLKKLIFDCIEELNGRGAQHPRIKEVEAILPGQLRKVLVKRGKSRE